MLEPVTLSSKLFREFLCEKQYARQSIAINRDGFNALTPLVLIFLRLSFWRLTRLVPPPYCYQLKRPNSIKSSREEFVDWEMECYSGSTNTLILIGTSLISFHFYCTWTYFFSANITILKTFFSLASKGLYSHDPAQSCKDIRDMDVSRNDGEYWIHPAKSGKPLNVFCDMTTDGGELELFWLNYALAQAKKSW